MEQEINLILMEADGRLEGCSNDGYGSRDSTIDGWIYSSVLICLRFVVGV